MKKRICNVVLIVTLLCVFIYQKFKFIPFILGKNQNGINILAYHHIVPDKEKKEYWEDNFDVMELSLFEKHMQYLFDNGYQTVTLDELYMQVTQGEGISQKSVVLTFDDGYSSIFNYVQPILEKYNFCATVFIIGNITSDFMQITKTGSLSYIGKEEIREHVSLLSFYSHGYGLHDLADDGRPILESMTREEFEADIFQQSLITSSEYLAYPWGKGNKALYSVMEENGIKLAFEYGNFEGVTKDSYKYAIPRWAMLSFITTKDLHDILH